MKHHITTIIAFAAALLLQVSCYDLRFGDAFLGEHPESSGATLDTLFSSAANADRVLTKAYSYLPYGLPTGKDNGHAYDKLGVNILESITDLNNSRRENVSDGPRNLYYSGAYGSNIASDSRGCEAYRFGEENEYSAIRYAWIYIENAGRVPDLSSVDRQRKVAEAKMVIAIAYSEMLRYMGGVPLLKHSVEENEEMYFPRATFAETVDYIVQLLDEAAPYLNWKNDGTENGRMTKAGALGLKLRILLWAASPTFNSDTPWHPQADAYTCYGNYDRERWKRAMDAGEEFFDELDANGGYKLTQAESQTHAGYRAAFRSAYYDRGGTEILITTRRGYNVDILDGFMSQASQSGPTLNYVNMFAWADGTDFPEDYDWEHPGNETRQPFFDASGNPTREPRLYETVAVPGDTWKDGSMAPVFTNSQKYVAGVGFLQKKFILDTDSDRAGKPVQWPYLRLPEVMLSYAEAINEYNGGPDDIAYKQINDVRARVGMPAVPSGLPQTEFREALIKERALEFGYEEVRWFDLVRWGRKDDFTKKLYGLQSTGTGGSNPATNPESFTFSVTELQTRNWATSWDTKWYLAAFPQTEVDKDYGIVQNPGW